MILEVLNGKLSPRDKFGHEDSDDDDDGRELEFASGFWLQ